MVCLVSQSCPAFCNPMDCSPPGSSVHGGSPGKNTGVGLPNPESNSGLPHCRRILYHLSHQGSSVVNNPPANAGDKRDMGLIPKSRRSPGGGHGNPLQYSCLENPMDRGAWWATVHSIQSIVIQSDMTKRLITHAPYRLR